MATCPSCGGFLHDRHRCHGRWRRRVRSAAWTLAGVVGGAVVSFVVTEHPALALIATDALLGAVLVTAVRTFAKF